MGGGKIRRLGFLLVMLFFVSSALNINAGVYNGSTVVTNNIHDHVYSTNSKVSNSYLFNNGDGTFTRLENMGDIILIEKYNTSYKTVFQGAVGFELSIFGGFYAGQNYNYLIFGQPNPTQDSNVECIRIVKYSKDWVRLAAVSVKNCNTTIPFFGSGTDICENGNLLYIKTGHQTYADGNGLHHQAGMMITYQSNTNQIKSVQSGLPGYVYGIVENSGAQYIDVTDGVLTSVDHSLTSPKSMLVSKYTMTSEGFPNFSRACSQVTALPIAGGDGSCTLGGYEASSQYYLVAGNTGTLDGLSPNRNIFIAAIPKNSFSTSATRLSFLTGYAYGELKSVETPYLVKINADQFAVLWETRSGYTDLEEVSYVFINGAGQMTSEIKTMNGCLSDCQPIVFNNQIVWYVTNGASMKIYTVPLSANRPTTPSQAVVNTGANIYQGVDYSAVFDFNYYINKYPDMRIFYANNQAGALQHFIQSGMAEGRQACENFNVSIYQYNYPDLQAAFGNDLRRYYMHFITNGNVEGRNARTKIR